MGKIEECGTGDELFFGEKCVNVIVRRRREVVGRQGFDRTLVVIFAGGGRAHDCIEI